MKKLEDGSAWIKTLKVIYWIVTVIIILAAIGFIAYGFTEARNGAEAFLTMAGVLGGGLLWFLWWAAYTGYITSFKQRRTMIHLLYNQVNGDLNTNDNLV